MTRLLRVPGVADRTGLRVTAIYDRIKRGLLVPPVKAARSSLFPEDEITAIVEAQIGGATDAQLRELVSRLVADRPQRAERVLKKNGSDPGGRLPS